MVGRLTVPGAPALAVQGGVRVLDTARPASGGLVVTLGGRPGCVGRRPRAQRAGLASHGVAYEMPGEKCVCGRFDCGGLVPVGWCREHGEDVSPVLYWHPGGGVRCPDLARHRTTASVHG
ncbi:hypothetical protein AB0F18_32200 [Streptomyces sp. NPDC029216]|uniref:hypothetical protein n=1 Tax=Streptomyces sp. NPDC029216 TaxID=3154701 RepID=UPI0033C78D89